MMNNRCLHQRNRCSFELTDETISTLLNTWARNRNPSLSYSASYSTGLDVFNDLGSAVVNLVASEVAFGVMCHLINVLVKNANADWETLQSTLLTEIIRVSLNPQAYKGKNLDILALMNYQANPESFSKTTPDSSSEDVQQTEGTSDSPTTNLTSEDAMAMLKNIASTHPSVENDPIANMLSQIITSVLGPPPPAKEKEEPINIPVE